MGITAAAFYKQYGKECYLIGLKGNENSTIDGMASYEKGGRK